MKRTETTDAPAPAAASNASQKPADSAAYIVGEAQVEVVIDQKTGATSVFTVVNN